MGTMANPAGGPVNTVRYILFTSPHVLPPPFPIYESYRRNDAMAAVNRNVKVRKPIKDEEESTFVGVSTGHLSKLGMRNDPVAFSATLEK